MADAKDSDRNIARVVGVSQPTITRYRHQFLKTGIIQSFEIIPNLAKLGFEIMACTVFKFGEPVDTENYRVVYAAPCDKGTFIISVHKNFIDYLEFVCKYNVVQRCLVPLSETPLKQLSFKDISLSEI